jgi:hypothetical protein
VQDIKELVKYSVTDEAIEQYREEFLPLTISGLDDHEGYEKVKNARLFIKGERVNVKKKRVELKASALEYGRAVDAEAKRITTAIEEVEDHLMAEQKKIDDENARIKFEKQQREKLPDRIAKLVEIGVMQDVISADELVKLDDVAFADLLNRLTAEKLEKQRISQEETERKQREEQERIEAEKKSIEDKKLEAEREERHKAEVEEAKRKVAEDARIKAEIDAKRKEDERFAREAAAKAEQERIEAERPDNEKLHRFADSLLVLQFPEVTSKRAKAKVEKVKKLFVQIADELKAA